MVPVVAPEGFEFLSGLPERLRRRRLIVRLQAYFDESGTDGRSRFMVMAGLFGEAQVFAEVADEWERHLQAKHTGWLPHFKMDEACGLEGAFRHWREDRRDAKVREMAGVIDRNDLLPIVYALDLSAYEQVLGPWQNVGPRHHTLKRPCMLLFQAALMTVVAEAARRGSTRPMEIIFDHQDVFQSAILEEYPGFLQVAEAIPAQRAAMPIQPWFRDDRDWVLLQAADLLAGATRLLPEDDRPAFVDDLYPTLRSSGCWQVVGRAQMIDVEARVRVGLSRVDAAKHDVC